eukprot:1015379-Amphidinium_carterae.1
MVEGFVPLRLGRFCAGWWERCFCRGCRILSRVTYTLYSWGWGRRWGVKLQPTRLDNGGGGTRTMLQKP